MYTLTPNDKVLCRTRVFIFFAFRFNSVFVYFFSWFWSCSSGELYVPGVYSRARWQRRRPWSLLCLCDVFQALINSLCWLCTGALRLVLFQILILFDLFWSCLFGFPNAFCERLLVKTGSPKLPPATPLHTEIKAVIVPSLVARSSGAVWKSRWTSWAPVLNKPTVSVDVKQHLNNNQMPSVQRVSKSKKIKERGKFI